jgi:hypothetical protein
MGMWNSRVSLWFFSLSGVLAFNCAAVVCSAQPPDTILQPHLSADPRPTGEQPLPDIDGLIRQVTAQQRASRKTLSQYTYRSLDSEQILDSHGSVKKTTTKDFETFCIMNAGCFHRLTSVDGKPLPEDAMKRQNDEIDSKIAWIKERNEKIAAGQAPPPPLKSKKSDEFDDDDGVYAYFISMFLQAGPRLGTFSNVRRIMWHDRPSIAIDYIGNPNAKSQSLIEGVFRNLSGTVWMDEQDHALVRFEGRVYQDYKVGGGLLADVHKGATVQMDWIRVNDEVWLPAAFNGRGSARLLIFSNHSEQLDRKWSDYRKFRASSTILPGVFAAPDVPTTPEAALSQP